MAAERTLYAKENRRPFSRAESSVDIPFLILVLLLLMVGLTMLYSASYAQSEYDSGYTVSTRYLQKQAVCAVLGLGCMAVFSRIPAKAWLRLAWPLYGISILLLLSVLVIGEEVNGARRWINLAGIQFQPSEIAKFTMILLFARLTKDFGPSAQKFRYGVLGFGAGKTSVCDYAYGHGSCGDDVCGWDQYEMDPRRNWRRCGFCSGLYQSDGICRRSGDGLVESGV